MKPRRPVKTFAQLINGYPFDSEDFSDSASMPLVRIRDLNAESFETFIDPDLVPDRVVLKDGQVVIGMDGDFHVRLWSRGHAAMNQRVCALVANGESDPRFLAYALPEPLRTINDLTYSTTVKHLSSGQVLAIGLPDWNLEEQRAIADFLDRETAQIDAMIDAQREVADLLMEHQIAAWAGTYIELAESYPLVPVRAAVSSLVDGPFGSSLTSAHYVDEGTRVIRLGNVGTNEFKSEDEAFIDPHYAATLQAHSVRPGDVVMGGLGDESHPLGRACLVPPDLGPAIVKADCYRLRPTRHVEPAYLAWALSAPPVLAATREAARGSTRLRLNTSIAKAVRFVLPDLRTQMAVVQTHSERVKHLSAALAAAERTMELLRERREALITAAVTGRIDPETGIEAPIRS